MKLRGELGLFLAGIALTAFGATMIVFSPKNADTTQAQAAQPYSMTWKATKVFSLVMMNGNSELPGSIVLGPSQWVVTGNISGKNFTETWNTPSLIDVGGGETTTTYIRRTSGGEACYFPKFNPSKWAVGCFQMGGGAASNSPLYKIHSQWAPFDGGNRDHTNNDGGQGTQSTVSCSNLVGLRCVMTTGAYGFSAFHTTGSDAEPFGGGMLMPLEWNVTGSISN